MLHASIINFKKAGLLILLFFLNVSVFSQKRDTANAVFKIDSIPHHLEGKSEREYGLKLPEKWKYKKGDDLKWADTSYKDSEWSFIDTEINLDELPEGTFENIGWFRLTIEIDSNSADRVLGLMVNQFGASEIYVDGKLIQKFGVISSADFSKQERFNPKEIPMDITFKGKGRHLIAVRYSHAKALQIYKDRIEDVCGFNMKLGELEDAAYFKYIYSIMSTSFFVFYFTFFFALSILHFALFMFYRSNRTNLYYSVFAAAFACYFLFIVFITDHLRPDFTISIAAIFPYLSDIYIPAFFAMLYSIFRTDKKLPKLFWIFFAIVIADTLSKIFNFDIPYINYVLNLILVIEPFRIIIVAIAKKREGAWIIGSGIIFTIVFFLFFFLTPFFRNAEYLAHGAIVSFIVGGITLVATVSIPLSMTIFLARDFAKTNKKLEKKLVEVEELSTKAIEQEKEKQSILANQNVVLEQQVKERTYEIVEQKKVIEEKNKDITDSINYAQRIQGAILPPTELRHKLFPESFVLFQPKDIVSGDFYWFIESNGTKMIAAADCTGHGVPGAMVSVVCCNALNRAVKEFKLTDPGKILDKTRELVLETFEKSTSEVKDGMDISLLTILPTPNGEPITIQWAGANNPLWYLQSGEFKEVTADKQPIGKSERTDPFTTHTLKIEKGTCVYLFTDGFADQFGGAKGKKFKYKPLQEEFTRHSNMPMEDQRNFLFETFNSWKGSIEQVDDVCIIGIRL